MQELSGDTFDPLNSEAEIHKRGLHLLLPEMIMLDSLLKSRNRGLRDTLLKDGYLHCIHQRLMHLCRKIALAVNPAGEDTEAFSRWLYMRIPDIARLVQSGDFEEWKQ